MKTFVVSTIVSLAAGTALVSPVSAQQHTGHDMAQPQQSAGQAAQQCAEEAQRHRAMGHTVPDGACKPKPEAEAEMDYGSMDRSQMNHGAMPMAEGQTGMAMPMNQSGQQVAPMDHGTMTDAPAPAQGMQGMDHSTMQMNSGADIPLLPPPPEAGSGPARAAIAIWGEASVCGSRATASNIVRAKARMAICGMFRVIMAATSTSSGSDPKAKARSAIKLKVPRFRDCGAGPLPRSLISRQVSVRI